MNFNNEFLPICSATDLKEKELKKVYFQAIPLVLLRVKETVKAFYDFCPHRGVPLSDGKLVDNVIECVYHGWKFDAETGENTFIPVSQHKIKCSLKAFYILEKYGLIWASMNENAQFPQLFDEKPNIFLKGEVKAKLENTLENFLEGSHTHYVHDGLIRKQKAERQRIKAIFRPNDYGFEVIYEAEPPKGILTKLIPKRFQVLMPTAKFIYPNIAILEYFDQNNQLISRFEGILGINDKKTTYFARIFFNLGNLNSVIEPFAKWFFKKIIEQDKLILEMQEQNIQHFDFSFVSDESDLVGKQIFAWLYSPDKIIKESKELTLYW